MPRLSCCTTGRSICAGRRRGFHIRSTSAACSGSSTIAPEDELTGLCWGDARLGNTMYTPDYKSVLALLDWEMAVLGNRVKDLAWWLFLDEAVSKHLGIGQLEGFPTEEESVAYWQRTTGLDASAFQYYKLHAAYAFGLILTRTAICSGGDDPAGNNFITPVMSRMLRRDGWLIAPIEAAAYCSRVSS